LLSGSITILKSAASVGEITASPITRRKRMSGIQSVYFSECMRSSSQIEFNNMLSKYKKQSPESRPAENIFEAKKLSIEESIG
jgi:hypothetical protein